MTSENFLSASRPRCFTGREAVLQQMRATLLREQVAVIAGPDGVGKTALAQEYADRYARQYQHILWMNATSEAAFVADTLDLVQRLSLSIDVTQGFAQILAALQGWLAQQEASLLVLDGVAIEQWRQHPPNQHHPTSHVLLIAHVPVLPSTMPRIDLDILAEEDGALLTLRLAGLLPPETTLEQAMEEQRVSAQEVARELGAVPLALSLAGSYLRETGESMQNYLLAYRDTPTRLPLPQIAPVSGHNAHAVQIACNLTMAYLERLLPEALPILRICALLLPDSIPAVLFEGGDRYTEPPQQQTTLLTEVLHVLRNCGLLVLQENETMLSIHPLVQMTVRQTMAVDEQQLLTEQALDTFYRLLPSIAQEELSMRLRVAGHVLQLATLSQEWQLSFDKAGDLFVWAASLLWEQGLVRAAESGLRSALAAWERVLGPWHAQVATVLLNLASLNCLLKKYGEAEAFSHRAIVAKARALGAHHPDVLLALSNLARIYTEQGKREQEWSCYEKALSIGKRAKLQKHPFYSALAYDFAVLLIEQEQFDEAEPLLQEVCSAWGQPSATGDMQTIEALLQLAEVSVRLGHWRQAETCYQQALPTCEAVLGAEHPEILRHRQQAAHVLIQLGRLVEAESNLRCVLSARERILGAGHPDVAASLNALAQIALEREQFAEALALLERAQSIYESRPEPEDLALAEVLDSRAIIDIMQQRYESAISTLERCLRLRERILGEEHPDLVDTLSALGDLYLAANRPDEAEPRLMQALAIYQRAQKPEDMALDPVINNLATLAAARGHYWQAEMYLERSRAIRELALGEQHVDTAEIWQKLAVIASAQEQWEKAELLYQRALSVYQKELGETHAQTLACLGQLAPLYMLRDRMEEAVVALQRILLASEQELGEEHPDLLATLTLLGQTYLKWQHFAEAETYLKRALTIYNRVPDTEALGISLLFGLLAVATEGQGKQEQAAAYLRSGQVVAAQIKPAAPTPNEV